VWPVDGTQVQQRAIGVGGWKEKQEIEKNSGDQELNTDWDTRDT